MVLPILGASNQESECGMFVSSQQRQEGVVGEAFREIWYVSLM
jgi:hypothetical protein